MSIDIGQVLASEFVTDQLDSVLGASLPQAEQGIVNNSSVSLGGVVINPVELAVAEVTKVIGNSLPVGLSDPINRVVSSVGGSIIDSALQIILAPAAGFGQAVGIEYEIPYTNPLPPSVILWKDQLTGDKLGLILQCTEEESVTINANITQYPIDSGFMIADHVMRQHPDIHLKGIITNTQMVRDAGSSAVTQGLEEVISYLTRESPTTDAVGTKILNDSSNSVPVEATNKVFNDLVISGNRVGVATIKGFRDNCVLISYGYVDNVDKSNQLEYQLTFKQVTTLTILGSGANSESKVQQTSPTETQKLEKQMSYYGVNVHPKGV